MYHFENLDFFSLFFEGGKFFYLKNFQHWKVDAVTNFVFVFTMYRWWHPTMPLPPPRVPLWPSTATTPTSCWWTMAQLADTGARYNSGKSLKSTSDSKKSAPVSGLRACTVEKRGGFGLGKSSWNCGRWVTRVDVVVGDALCKTGYFA